MARSRTRAPDLAEPDLAETDLLVVSHLRWPWVWQRPQHLVSRFAQRRRTWFVEEPIRSPLVVRPVLRRESHGRVERVWLEVPGDEHAFLPFGGEETDRYIQLLSELLGERALDVWLYSPMALDIAEGLQRRLLVYDVMDDLASFAHAPQGLVLRQRRLLDEADVVFTGGRSLHEGVVQVRGDEHTHRFSSGVELAHFAQARLNPEPHERPVAGYVGVIDERIDLQLLHEMVAALPDWDVHLVGPITKIDPADVPQGPNIRAFGLQPYERLPELMSAFDVALMPFARNEATRSISPTKTLEYLAAGLPVVSTRVPDVVSEWGNVVHLADTGAEFAVACRHVLDHSLVERDARAATLSAAYEWDHIASEMERLLEQALDAESESQRQRGSA